MIPAKIISIDDKVMVKYGDTIAEVESYNQSIINHKKIDQPRCILFIGQTVFIEPTENNKCRIIKIN